MINKDIRNSDFLNTLPVGEYIVHIEFKYPWEKCYTSSYELFFVDTDERYWLNDWNEGQDDVKYIGFINVANVDNLMKGEKL